MSYYRDIQMETEQDGKSIALDVSDRNRNLSIRLTPGGGARYQVVPIPFMTANALEYTHIDNSYDLENWVPVYGIVLDAEPEEYSPSEGDILFIRATSDLKVPQYESSSVIDLCIWLKGERPPYTDGVWETDKVFNIENGQREYQDTASNKVVFKKNEVFMLRCRKGSDKKFCFDLIGFTGS